MDEFTVLLVDDEEEFRDILTKRLRKRKLRLFGVGNGDDAMRLLSEQQVDVVVLDVRMPGKDGTQILQEIKQAHPAIEVIMLTGHADVDVALKGMQLGAYDYLIKPVDIDELVYRLQDAYQKKCLKDKKRGEPADAT